MKPALLTVGALAVCEAIHPSLLQRNKIQVTRDYELKIGLEAEVGAMVPAEKCDGHKPICKSGGVSLTGDMFDASYQHQTLELVTEPVDFGDGEPNLEPLLSVVEQLHGATDLKVIDGCPTAAITGKVYPVNCQATFGIQVSQADKGCRSNDDCKTIFGILAECEEKKGYYPDLHYNVIKKKNPSLSPDNDPAFKNAYGLYPRWKASDLGLDIANINECTETKMKAAFGLDTITARGDFNQVKAPYKSATKGWIALVEDRNPGIVVDYIPEAHRTEKKDGKWHIIGGDLKWQWGRDYSTLVNFVNSLNP